MRRTSHIHSRTWLLSSIFLVVALAGEGHANKEGYYGKYIGKLSQLHHGVSGDVFAVDSRTLHLRNFNYDGEGPAAYFYAGNTKTPGANGFRLRDERGTQNVLPKYRNKHITITLPEGKTLQNIRWFSVWCDEFSVNFGDVKIPKNLDYPKPQKIDGLSGVHGVSSEPIVIVDAQTLLVPSFSYDGEAPDAKFWVGAGPQPSPRGIRIPDENGKEVPLRRYDRKTIVLTLPGDLTIFDIGHFGVWCEAFTVDFGHIQIPRGLNVPPSLKMLGVSPQSKLNCEVLWDDFAYEVRWAVAGDSIVLQLVARLENNEYMSFGLSGDKSRSRMVGGDVVVAWVDKESLKGYAEDYYLDAKSQCSGGRGSCPDENIERDTGSVRLLNAALVNGYSIVTFQRSLKAQDELDKSFLTNGSQPVIWAIGPLNSKKEVSYHSLTNRGDIFMDFGRAPKWNCPTPESVDDEPSSDNPPTSDVSSVGTVVQNTGKKESHYVQESGLRESHQKTSIPTPAPAPKSQAWEIPEIKCHEPEDGVFYAQMGPTGGKHGYSAITGHVGWGISWYINGLLIPEINVVRGRTYTFIVEGGLDPNTPAKYHPFYITDDPVGGYQYKTPEERLNIQIFAGAVQNKRGEVRPTGIGRLCNWTPDPDQPPADEFASFGAYQRTLRLECDPGNPGIIQWTVAKDTPDTVYYQCYTHRYLGWKIKVHDDCESQSGSDPVPAILEPPEDFQINFEGSESINYEVKVKPENNDFFQKNRKHQTVNPGQEGQPGSNLTSEANVNAKIWNEQFATFKDVYGEMKQPEEQIVDILPRPVQSLSKSEANTAQPHRQYITSSALSLGKTQESPELLSTSNQMLGLSSFASIGTPFKNYNSKPNFKNFQILPSNAEAYSLTNFRDYHPSKKDTEKKKLFFQIPSTVEQMKNGENAGNRLRIEENGKLKKISLKPDYRVKVVPKSPSAVPFVPRVTRKPSFVEASASQRRPHPFGINKSSDPTSSIGRQKFSTHATHVDPVAIPLFKYSLPFEMDGKRFKMHPERNVAAIAHRQRPQIARFAQNTGFDPNSVKIESGFKPILQTEKVSYDFDEVDRADVRVEEDDDKRVPENEEKKLTEKGNDKKEHEVSEGVVRKGTNSFTSRSPQLFRPMFVPSFPDKNFRKRQDKSKADLVTISSSSSSSSSFSDVNLDNRPNVGQVKHFQMKSSSESVGNERSVPPAESEPSKDESKVGEGPDRKKRSPDDHDPRRHHDHDDHDHHDHRDHDVNRLNLGGAAVVSCNGILLVGGFTFLSMARHHLFM